MAEGEAESHGSRSEGAGSADGGGRAGAGGAGGQGDGNNSDDNNSSCSRAAGPHCGGGPGAAHARPVAEPPRQTLCGRRAQAPVRATGLMELAGRRTPSPCPERSATAGSGGWGGRHTYPDTPGAHARGGRTGTRSTRGKPRAYRRGDIPAGHPPSRRPGRKSGATNPPAGAQPDPARGHLCSGPGPSPRVRSFPFPRASRSPHHRPRPQPRSPPPPARGAPGRTHPAQPDPVQALLQRWRGRNLGCAGAEAADGVGVGGGEGGRLVPSSFPGRGACAWQGGGCGEGSGEAAVTPCPQRGGWGWCWR